MTEDAADAQVEAIRTLLLPAPSAVLDLKQILLALEPLCAVVYGSSAEKRY